MSNLLPRRRTGQRAAGALAVIAAAVAMIAALASPADAASEAAFTDLLPGASATITGTYGGRTQQLDAGLMGMVIDGASDGAGYCIDINTQIDPGESGLGEIDWATSGVPQLSTVEMILGSYHPAGAGPAGYEITGTDAQRAAATQAAIWHYTDGYTLSPTDNDAVIVANYDSILRAVADGVLPGFGEPDVSLTITAPADSEAVEGDAIGPFVVRTTATSVTLTPSAGVSIVDAAGNPLPGPVVDGTELWLVSDAPGDGDVTASADASVRAGRVFAKEGVQRLILATTVESTVGAEATARWTERPDESTTTTTAPPPTSTTTVPPTTDTTLPPTTDTTVVVTPQTGTPPTVPPTSVASIEPQPQPQPQPAPSTPVEPADTLPRTGQDAGPLVAIGLALLATGGLLGTIARRRRPGM